MRKLLMLLALMMCLCGAALAEELRITGASLQADGTVALAWCGGRAPFRLRYTACLSENAAEDAASPQGYGRWLAEKDCMAQQYAFTQLAPGRAYWLSVADAAGREETLLWEPETPASFADFPFALTLETSRNGEKADFVAGDIAGAGQDVGLTLYMTYGGLEQPRAARLTLVFVDTTGDALADFSAELTFAAKGYYRRGWNPYSLNWYFGQVMRKYGCILPGEYGVEAYIDGRLAARAAFVVHQQPPTPTPVPATATPSPSPTPAPSPTPSPVPLAVQQAEYQDDGAVLLTWADPAARGPYRITWFERHTDDPQKDRASAWHIGEMRMKQTGLKCEITALIPGMDYWLCVTDAAGRDAFLAYNHPTGKFLEFPVDISATLRRRDNETLVTIDQSCFYTDRIANERIDCGLTLTLEYPTLAYSRDYRAVFVLTAPTGHRLVDWDTTVYMLYSDHTVTWGFYSLEGSFAALKKGLGEIPTGTYTLTLHLQGGYAAELSFMVLP